MTTLEIVYLVVLGTCILSSGFLSGSETALVALPRERLHQIVERDRRGHMLEELLADPDRMLGTLLVANNFVNILGASVATVLFIDLLGDTWGPWVATFSVTAAILVVGEITPKTLAARRPEQYSLFVARAIWSLSRIIQPIVAIFTAISRVLLRLFGLRDDERPVITEEDIRALALLGEREGEIEAAEREIIHSLFELADRPIRDVMTPRVEIVALQDPAEFVTIRDLVATTGHSRYPVVDESLDHIVGVLYVKDLMRLDGQVTSEDIRRVYREPYYVPETHTVLGLLQDMRDRRFGFAVVVDEHGGVEGIVTDNDLVSELVGELQDEYDPGVPSVVPMGPDTWLAHGRVTVEQLEVAVGVELPRGPYTTAAGLFLDRLGHIPHRGETIEIDGLITLEVLRLDRNRIDRIEVRRTK